MARNQQDVLNEAMAGEVVVNIGQLDAATVRELDKLARRGTLAKWRGHWYPTAGANFGIGPLKSCWGKPELLTSPFVSNPSPINGVAA